MELMGHPTSTSIVENHQELLLGFQGEDAGGVWASPPVGEISGDLCKNLKLLQGRYLGELHIQHLSEEFAQFGGGDAAEQLSGECPFLDHYGIGKATVSDGI